MFCNSLRKRPELSPLIPLLSQSQTPKWQEQLLETHDLALPTRGPSGPSGQPDFFRIVLLSAPDLQNKEHILERLERLSNLTGGKDVGIVFLLASSPRANSMVDYLQLQTDLFMASIEIMMFPVSSIESLPKTIFQFQRTRLQARHQPPVTNSIKNILPYCSANGPLSEHNTYVLSDVCTGFRDVTMAVSTTEGREELSRYLDDQQIVADVVDFWSNEYICE